MVNLLEDYDDNISNVEEDTNNICMCINLIEDKNYRDYAEDFIGYKLIKNNEYTVDIIINNEILNKNTLKLSYYYNSVNKNFYVEHEEKLYFDSINGHIEFIIKKNNNILDTVSFNYKLNDPLFNTDIIKVVKKSYIFYIYLKRPKLGEKFYIYKIIYTNFN